jgi:uncharacterized protein (DUF1778 family)
MAAEENFMRSAVAHEARVEFSLPLEWKTEIERAATVLNRSVADFATRALHEAAQKVLADHAREAHISLSNRDRDRFLSMLDNPPPPNRALKAAARRHQRRVSK